MSSVCGINFHYHDNTTIVTPRFAVNGWTEMGTFNDGIGQKYTKHLADGTHEERDLDINNPHYCSHPYTSDYVYGDGSTFSYYNISCVEMPLDMIAQKQMPTYMFYTTFVQVTLESHPKETDS